MLMPMLLITITRHAFARVALMMRAMMLPPLMLMMRAAFADAMRASAVDADYYASIFADTSRHC